LGEEVLLDKRYSGRHLETAYAESESVSVLELSTDAFMRVKELFYESGLKKDFLMLETTMRRVFVIKKNLRQ
jgi:hypothetical protein